MKHLTPGKIGTSHRKAEEEGRISPHSLCTCTPRTSIFSREGNLVFPLSINLKNIHYSFLTDVIHLRIGSSILILFAILEEKTSFSITKNLLVQPSSSCIPCFHLHLVSTV